MHPLDSLIACANTTRLALEPGLAQSADGMAISAGSCLHASVLLAAILTRFGLASAVVRGGDGDADAGALDACGRWRGHYWVEAGLADGQRFVIDLTADQFGHAPVRVIPVDVATGYRPGDQDEVDVAASCLRAELELDRLSASAG
mgnify:CR=1 FL=1